jgi:hypothetical protein
MHDKRVARGSTYAQPTVAPSVLEEQARIAAEMEERKRRRLAETKRRAEAEEAARALEVPPVAGRQHTVVSGMQGFVSEGLLSDLAAEPAPLTSPLSLSLYTFNPTLADPD